MNRIRRSNWVLATGVVIMTMAAGCGVSTKKVEQARARIETLAEQGAPDSALASAKVLVAEVEGAMKAMNTAEAAKKAEALEQELARVDTWLQQALAAAGPELQAARTTVEERKADLTGLHLKTADSLLAPVDSLATAGRVLQARAALAKLEKLMPSLLEAQKTAAEVRGKVVGTWREVARPDATGATSVETRTYTFGKDGSLRTEEEKKGQSGVGLKENWAFESWGNWEMKGDTVHMHIEREKCLRQIYETLVKKDGRETWERNVGPAYDSTITDGRKDRWMVFGDLSASFKRIR